MAALSSMAHDAHRLLEGSNIPDFYTMVVIGMAAQRLTAIWIAPLGILTPIRIWFAEKNPWSPTIVKLGVNCGMCVSMWASVLMYLIWQFGSVGQTIVIVFAIGSVASMVNAFTKGI